MKKNSRSKTPAAPKIDPYLESLMAKLLERLVGLERKLDVVVAQTAGRTPSGDKPAQTAEIKPQPPRRERQLYEAICADCHKVCEVPFKPSENRPVYCKECFAKRKAGGGPQSPFPVLTPVAMPPKPAAKPVVPPPPPPPAAEAPKKGKKAKPAKKGKKRK